MNTTMAVKIETCIELCNGNANTFKKNVLKVTSLTDKGFHELGMTDVAFNMLQRKESIRDILNAVA